MNYEPIIHGCRRRLGNGIYAFIVYRGASASVANIELHFEKEFLFISRHIRVAMSRSRVATKLRIRRKFIKFTSSYVDHWSPCMTSRAALSILHSHDKFTLHALSREILENFVSFFTKERSRRFCSVKEKENQGTSIRCKTCRQMVASGGCVEQRPATKIQAHQWGNGGRSGSWEGHRGRGAGARARLHSDDTGDIGK